MRAKQLLLCLGVPCLLRASPLDCADQSDPVVKICCDAQSAWSSMESAGGCGTTAGSAATAEQCSTAQELCQQCRSAVREKDSDSNGALMDQTLGFISRRSAG